MTSHFPFALDVVQQFGPPELHSYRTSRYFGDDNSVVLAAFSPEDRDIIRQQYQTLLNLFGHLQQVREHGTLAIDLAEWYKQADWNGLIQRLKLLGNTSSTDSLVLREVIHDIRGGSFVALSMGLQLYLMRLGEANELLRMFFLTRDHLKMMRNAVRDLDPEVYARDWQQKLHGMDLLVEKWSAMDYNLTQSSARIHLDCHFDGAISERCLEFSALDRVIYNIVNNAVRHAADNNVYLVIVPVEAEQPHNVRFVIYNKLTPEHQAVLAERFADGFAALFAHGASTTGSGLGLSICAHFVGNAYGINAGNEAVAHGYLGATERDGYFVTWFHWPIAGD